VPVRITSLGSNVNEREQNAISSETPKIICRWSSPARPHRYGGPKAKHAWILDLVRGDNLGPSGQKLSRLFALTH
jgi:hypothetical protein